MVNSKIKHKSKAILGGSDRNLVLDFIIFFVTAYMRKYATHVISVQGATQIHHALLKKVSKKYSMRNNLQQSAHTKTFKIVNAMKKVHIM